jgi:diaminopropionate ammonia-lyase
LRTDYQLLKGDVEAGAGGLIELLAGTQAEEARDRLGVTGSTRVLLVATEGATDPAAYERIVGHL